MVYYTYAIISGTETSRTMRVGTCPRKCNKRIAVVSQELEPVEYNTQNNKARKRHAFSYGVEMDFLVVWVVQIDLISVWGIGLDGIDVISVWGSMLTWSQCTHRNRLGFVWGSKMTWFRVVIEWTWISCWKACEIELFSEWGLKLTWLQCRDRDHFVFMWGIQKDLVLVSGSKFSCYWRGVKIYIGFVMPKPT